MAPDADQAPRVRLARITDLSALVEISRRAQRALQDGSDEMRSLGLPIGPAALSLYQLVRMPLSLVRSSDAIWIHQRGAFADGLARVERDDRGDWTIVELDAVDDAARARLLARVVREAGRHGVVRLHVACAEDSATMALLGAAGFQSYARETLYLLRNGVLDVAPAVPNPMRPVQASDARRIAQLIAATTPAAVTSVEPVDARDWERAAAGTWAPRASITPLLRLVEQSAFVAAGSADDLVAWIHLGVARERGEEHPHALRISVAPGVDPLPFIRAGLGEIADRARRAGTAESGVLAVVRSYEIGLGAVFVAQGFAPIGDLRLAVRDARARVGARGLLPATS